MKLEVQKLAVSRAEKISDKLHLFLHSNTNNQSYYDVDFDNLRIAHKRNIVLEVNTYYPYGMLNTSLSWHLTNNQFKYQSKEYLNTLNYNVLDFGARLYDPAIARFTTPDPIMQFNNGYFAMGGNPVSMIDPSGMKAEKDFQGYDEGPSLTQQPPSGGGGSPVTIDGMPLYGSTPMLEHIMGELMAKGPDGEDNILGYSSSTLSVNIIQKDDKIFTSFNPVYQMVNTINNNYKSKYANYNIQGKDDRESGETDDYFTGFSWGPAIAQSAGGSVQNILGFKTFENNTGGTVWVKPENNSLSAISLANGESTAMRIDGVTHPKYPGQVFKVVDWVDVIFGVYANSWFVNVNTPEGAELNQIGGGGWLSIPPDSGWNDIFSKAGWKAP